MVLFLHIRHFVCLSLFLIPCLVISAAEASPKGSDNYITFDHSGEVSKLSLEDMKAQLSTEKIKTVTYWSNGEEVLFEGFLLKDVLALGGFEDAEEIGVVALDDYTARINREEILKTSAILAFSQNGGALEDGFGPFWIVSFLSKDLTQGLQKGHWVWAVDLFMD